jgi:ribonuclease J
VPKVLICQNGDLVRLAPGEAAVIDELPHGRLYKDGALLESDDAEAVAERRRMGFAGAVFVALAVTEKGELAEDPQIELVGVPERDAAGDALDERVYDIVVSTFESLPRGRRRDGDATAESIRRAVRAELGAAWGKRPLCYVKVLVV